MKTISPRWILIGLTALTVSCALAGCRPAVDVESDLAVELFERPSASLTVDPGGHWYIVAARGAPHRPFLTVEHDSKTHLFAVESRGERSARLLPLTPVDAHWFDEATASTPELRFYEEDDLTDIYVDETLGLWEGGEQLEIRWLGPEPASSKRAVVIPVGLELGSVSMPTHMVGTVDVDADGIAYRRQAFAPHRGPYLLLPDGPVTDTGPRAASQVELPVDDATFPAWSLEQVDGHDVRNDAELKEAAGRLSVELLVARQGPELRIGFAADGGPPARGNGMRRVAIAESGFIVDGDADDETMLHIMHAVDALYADHPLSAAYHLAEANAGDHWHVDENQRATMLRHQDLLAAAGFAPWMRAVALENQEGVGPEIWLYLARAAAYAQDWSTAEIRAQRAIRLFENWPRRPGAIGMGTTRLLIADMLWAQHNHGGAIATVERAVDDFVRADDPYRAALADRRARLADGHHQFARVIDGLLDAGAPYEASRTLLFAAATDIDGARFEEASQRLDIWTEEFGADASQGELLFAQALTKRLHWYTGQEIDTKALAEAGEEAEALHSWDAAVTFALTQHGQRAMYDEMNLDRLGRLLVEGTLRSDSTLFEGELEQALGVICADVVFSMSRNTQTGLVERHCQRTVDHFMTTADGVRLLLDGGYRFLQRGELQAAQDLENYVFSRLPDQERIQQDQQATPQNWTSARARSLLYRAALAEEMHAPDRVIDEQTSDSGDPVVDAIQASFGVIRNGVPAEQAPRFLRDLGDEFDARGMERISLNMYRASKQAAIEAGRDSAVFDAALALADVLEQFGEWEELRRLENVASPLHAARIHLYRGQAYYMTGDEERGQELMATGLEQSEEFGALQRISIAHLGARLALDRDDLDDTQAHVERAMDIIETLSDGVAQREESRVLEARVRTRRGQMLLAQGQRQQAEEEVDRALELFAQLPSGTAPHVLREVYEAALEITDDGDRFEELLGDFNDLHRTLSEDVPVNARRDIARSLSQVLLENADTSQAMQRVRSVLGEGQGLAANRQEHHCLAAKARQFSGDERLANYHFEHCHSRDPDTALAAEGNLLQSLADPDASLSYRAGLAEHLRDQLRQSATGERTRLDWLASFSEPTVAVDEQREQELRARFQNSADEESQQKQQRLDAGIELIEYLIESGQHEEADRLLQSESGIFYEPELDAEDQWVLLRIESMVGQLRPFDVFGYIDRALSEAPPKTSDRRAKAHYLRAAAHLQLGQYFPATRALERAGEYAEPGTAMAEKIESLESTLTASRFGQ